MARWWMLLSKRVAYKVKKRAGCALGRLWRIRTQRGRSVEQEKPFRGNEFCNSTKGKDMDWNELELSRSSSSQTAGSETMVSTDEDSYTDMSDGNYSDEENSALDVVSSHPHFSPQEAEDADEICLEISPPTEADRSHITFSPPLNSIHGVSPVASSQSRQEICNMSVLTARRMFQRLAVKVDRWGCAMTWTLPNTSRPCNVFLSEDDGHAVFEEGGTSWSVPIDQFIGGITRSCPAIDGVIAKDSDSILSLFFISHEPVHLILSVESSIEVNSDFHRLQHLQVQRLRQPYLWTESNFLEAIVE
eukprot:gb/GEZN01010454.1/.p1 GENE.gb/GEZN01010454.1/~~gb/GEZN01010454.1/.p1  ORF type:complete len:304 (-),score=16.85 gb/GEZN01010454.1/:191-1102(-)